ncbi:MAG TPA: DUF1501 domain-containing protein [Gemmataceae bacterium]|nr:DUF1501 domain-containing protein [Gemmataceae bacterium]
MEPIDPLLLRTRRHFFHECGIGLGAMALGSLLKGEVRGAEGDRATKSNNPLAPKQPHFEPKAKAVIYLFMAGGPSQFELFEPKPELQKYHGQPIPDSFIQGKRFAFMDTFSKERPKLLGTKRQFARYGRCGLSVSELLPHLAQVVDEIAYVRTVATDVFNHAPAKLFMNTGSAQFGRPSMGSWLTYGLGSESQQLPGFVVLQSGPRGPRGGYHNWTSGFLPTAYQGVPFRSGGDPIVNLSNPTGISADRQRDTLDVVRDLNQLRFQTTGDAEITTRIAAYEMAYQMQTSAPDLINLSQETQQTLALYGAEPGKASYANNCLLARRLVERGVRFIQLYHTNWDHHGGTGEDLGKDLDKVCKEIDRPTAGLLLDLKQRGLLDSTLVIWGGEFGRTPMGEIRNTIGRNHHIEAFPMWLAGAGVKKGLIYGETDPFGFAPVSGRIHVHDIHATLLHLLGLDHTKLTFRFQGRDFRLTDVSGEVVEALLT